VADSKEAQLLAMRFIDDSKVHFQRLKNHLVQKSSLLSERESHEIVETLFFRLLFLRFLEEKQWLLFDGNSDYLSALCNSGGIDSKSIYESRLKPLFMKGLSMDGAQQNPAYGEVPFLDLDLFHETALDEIGWDISDQLIKSLLGKNGLFYNYDFTIAEFGSDKAINPEIIGALFEELMMNRKGQGVYYTPKPVVRYMCNEGIKRILEEKTNQSSDMIARLVDQNQVDGMSFEQADVLRKGLLSIKAIDPSCGSGAFLIGLLDQLARIHFTLSTTLNDVNASNNELKHQLLSGSIFGIDLDSRAVNRTRCRLWLSLAADSHQPITVSLEAFNIKSGDSLLGLEPECVRDVKASSGGFDLVLANPPYVRHGHLAQEYKKQLLEQYRDVKHSPVHRTSDLYCYFFVRANEFLRPNGLQIFICSNSWLDAGFGKNLQQYLLQENHIISLIDSRKKKQFGNADVNTIISIIRKSEPENTSFIMLESEFSESIKCSALRTSRRISQKELMESGFDNQGNYFGQRLSLLHRAPEIYLTLMEVLRPQSSELQQVARVSRGSTTGGNAFFYLSRKDCENYRVEKEYLQDVLRRPVESQSIRTSLSNRQTLMFTCSRTKESLEGTQALSYIVEGESKGYHQGSTCSSRNIWYNVNPNESAQILWMETMGSSHRVCFNDQGVRHSDKFYGIYPFEDKIDSLKLCIWLNSSPIILHKLLTSFNSLGLGALKSPVYEVKKIPVPDLDLLQFDEKALESFLQRPIQDVVTEMSMPDRKKLEEPIMSMLGFSQQQEDEMRLAIISLMSDRLDKASS